jgi:hypothetical protein
LRRSDWSPVAGCSSDPLEVGIFCTSDARYISQARREATLDLGSGPRTTDPDSRYRDGVGTRRLAARSWADDRRGFTRDRAWLLGMRRSGSELQVPGQKAHEAGKSAGCLTSSGSRHPGLTHFAFNARRICSKWLGSLWKEIGHALARSTALFVHTAGSRFGWAGFGRCAGDQPGVRGRHRLL